MGGGQTQTQNSTQVATRTPWDPAIPGLQRSLTDAQTLYQSGIGGQVYSGQRVADFNNDTNTGIVTTRDAAMSDNSGQVGTNYLQGVLGSGGGVSYNGPSLDANGLSAGTVGALAQLQGVKGADLSRLTGLGDYLADPNNAVNRTASSFMSGQRDISTEGDLRSLLGRALAPSSAETNLSDTAAGKYLDPTANPWVSKLAQTSADNALNATKQAFAASGRYGGGAFAGATTKAINDTQSQLFADEYNRERQNQLAATGQIDAARQAGTGLGNSIVGAITGVQGQNNQFRLAGAGLQQAQDAARANVEGQILGGNEFNSNLDLSKATTALGAYQQGTANAMQNEQARVGTALQSQGQALQAAGLLPAMSALRYQGGQALQGIGAAQQAQYQTGLDSLQDVFNETQQRPWQLLGQYASYPLAIGSQGGTTVSQGTSQTHTSGPSALQTALGLGSGLLSLGTGGGSSLGGGLLSSLFGSDERMKENIRPVGELKDGQTVYAYNYRGDDRPQIGLLAHEVAEKRPDAVGPIGLGDLLGVDYGKATDEAARLAARGSKDPKEDSGSSGGSAPASPPSGLMQAALGAAGAPASGRPGEAPRLTIVLGDARSGADGAPAGLGHTLAAMLDGRAPHGAGPHGLADLMRAMIPQEPAPQARREDAHKGKPPARGDRRKAA